MTCLLKNLECPPHYINFIILLFRKKHEKFFDALQTYQTSEIRVLMEKGFSIVSFHSFFIRIIYSINKISVHVPTKTRR